MSPRAGLTAERVIDAAEAQIPNLPIKRSEIPDTVRTVVTTVRFTGAPWTAIGVRRTANIDVVVADVFRPDRTPVRRVFV